MHGLVALLQCFLVIERFILSWEEALEGSTEDKKYFILIHSFTSVL